MEAMLSSMKTLNLKKIH